MVRNEGNEPIKVFKVDGGCACRRVDQAGLPVVLSPGVPRSISVELSMPPRAELENFMIQFQTDQGVVGVPVSMVILARDSLIPGALASPTLIEREDWEFEVIHRTVFESDQPAARLPLDVPAELIASEIGVHGGPVAIAPQFTYQDTKYRVTLKDKRMGLHKALLALKREEGRRTIELPVIWRRVAYLSTAPERAFLGPRPSRVFLRCPDDQMELTRVLSTPKGIKAVVSSPRELTVTLSDDAPAVIDGVVEVGTTAEGRPPLRVPVVRFSIANAKH